MGIFLLVPCLMEMLHRLLYLQNQSWFFRYKEYFCQGLRANKKIGDIFFEAKEDFPELGRRLEFPLRLSSPSFSFRWILYGQPAYPVSFYKMEDPPLVLTVLGETCWEKNIALSVVGSREPSSESLQWIDEELGGFVEIRRPILVSGGARGIDQAVHALAVRKKIPTIVFLPSGLAQIYPKNLEAWISQICDGGGCFISEYPLEQRMEKSLFHHRNRLIAHMGIATLIVQAAEKSGSLMTGHLAAEAGRPLWVVPGHPLRHIFRGNLSLLREGGAMVCSAEDLSLFFDGEEMTLNHKSAHLAVGRKNPTTSSD